MDQELESYGISTPSNLKKVLTTCSDPVEAIKMLQTANSIKLSSLKPAIKLLDLHNVPRSEFAELVISELNEKIILKIQALAKDPSLDHVNRLESQLEQCFPLFRVPRLQPIVLETLNNLPKIADRYLKLIVCDREFYEKCSTKVKQQIWLKNECLFIETIDPIIDSYVNEKEKLFLSIDKSTNFYTVDTVKTRRNWLQIKSLIAAISGYDVLYSNLVNHIKAKYIKTGWSHLCSLRFEILMAVHDLNMDCAKIDPCHEFAWCLDACLKAKHVDVHQIAKLKNLTSIDTNKKGANTHINEIAIIAADPHVTHFFCSMVVKLLRDNVYSCGSLPREQTLLQLFIKIVTIGTRGHEFVSGSSEVQCLNNPEIFTTFLPQFALMMTQDFTRLELDKVQETQLNNLSDYFNDVQLNYDVFERFFRNDIVSGLILIHYITNELLTTKKRIYEANAIVRYIQWLPVLAAKIAQSSSWMHLLVFKLIQYSSVDPTFLINDRLSSILVKEMMLKCIDVKFAIGIRFHLLRLCIHLKKFLPPLLVNEAYEALKHVATTEDEDGNCSHFSVIFQLEFEKYGSQIPIKILPPPALSEKQSSIDEMKEMNPCATATTDDN